MKNEQIDTCYTDVRYTCSTEVRRAYRELHSTNTSKLSKHSAVSQVQSELHQQRRSFFGAFSSQVDFSHPTCGNACPIVRGGRGRGYVRARRCVCVCLRGRGGVGMGHGG